MTVFAGVYFWYPKVFGRMVNERLGRLHFWSTFVFSNVTFFPMHWLGLEGMPRRVADYDAGVRGLEPVHLDLGASCLGAGMLFFVYNVIHSGPARRASPATTRGARMTLEWQVSSPPPIFNFADPAARRRRPVPVRRAGREARDLPEEPATTKPEPATYECARRTARRARAPRPGARVPPTSRHPFKLDAPTTLGLIIFLTSEIALFGAFFL